MGTSWEKYLINGLKEGLYIVGGAVLNGMLLILLDKARMVGIKQISKLSLL